MDSKIRPIKNSYSTNNGQPLEIVKFLDYYKSKVGIETGKRQTGAAIKNVTSSNSQVKSSETQKKSSLDKSKTLTAIVISLLGSTALAIGAHTTSVLDRFGDTIKQFTKFGLDFITVILGIATAGGYLNTLSNNSEPEEKKLKYPFDSSYSN